MDDITIDIYVTDEAIDLEMEITNEAIDLTMDVDTNVTINPSLDMMNVVAGENISSSNVVMLINGEAFKYQPGDETNYGRAVGIAKNATITGGTVTIQMMGKVNIPGWGLIPDALYYAASNGGVSVTPPSSGLLSFVGVAKDVDTLIVDIDEPIILN